MKTSAPAGGSADRALERRRRRPLQLITITLIGSAVSSVASLAADRVRDALILQVVALLLWLARWLVRHGQVARGVNLMLVTLTTMVAIFVVLGGGLRDVALLVFPVILFAAGMLGSWRTLLVLLGAMLVVIAGVGGAQIAGVHAGVQGPVSLVTLIDVVVILVVTAISVFLATGDLRQALWLLRRENRRVQRSQALLEHLAHHDALTGLPNRVLARDRFEVALARAWRAQRRVALLFLDLDHFKSVNDALGHQAGDELLRLAGRRLAAAVRASDTVCRVGGDEFLLVLGDLPDADAAAGIASKVLDALVQPFQIAGAEVHTSASVGVAVSPEDGTRFDELLKHVDTAMYRAKDRGGHTVCFFDAAMNTGLAEHAALVGGMRAGLPRGEFSLHYQPQLCLRTGRLVGAEALLRWRHPELGDVAPARFVPVAERSGFIVELGQWVLREACRQAAAWQDRLPADFRVSVNLSPVQVRRGNLEQVVLNALADAGLPPWRLELELTESMLLEDSRDFSGTLERLRAMGLRLAIDDFGTGYSNLGYLKRFEVGRLKIDQSFVRRLTHDAHDAAIVAAIVQMAHSLKLTTVAEGVEDPATRDRLVALGCDEAQGWLWSRALPPEGFERLIPPGPRDGPARQVLPA